MQILDKLKPLGLLVLRLGVAAIFLSSGYDKLFGSPGKWLAWFPKQGFPSYFAYIAGSLELFGAVLLVLGLLTRIIGLLLAIEMAIALWKVQLAAVGNLQRGRLRSDLDARRGVFCALHRRSRNALGGWSDIRRAWQSERLDR
jgi:uncharacterized membrane protein YphA (DoxX/SURF4 family)